ncbi:SAM-dependent methyltransferase [Prosthecomicrobium sp. N25]|uniref:SAM-dependent methyltransferase n=1 Tax=Prosthecomicrobium sp. N25 TaxID=3129254 RepID=UPI003076F3E2
MPNDDARLRQVVALLAPRSGERVLEIGCGHGVAIGLVLAQAAEARVVAVDRSPAMVAAARRRNAGFGDRVDVVEADLAALDLGGRLFDKIFAVRVGAFARKDAGPELAAAARHLAPSGRLYLFMDSPSGDAATLGSAMAQTLVRHGWRVLDRSPVAERSSAWVIADLPNRTAARP